MNGQLPKEKKMADADNTATAAETTTTDTTDASATAKEQIYTMIADFVKDATGKNIGKTKGRELFDRIIERVFAGAAGDRAFRFNGGFGSLHVKDYQAGSRRLPNGQETTFGERSKLRYEQGVVTTALVENGGNLEEALKARGSRAKPEGAAATTEKPAKPAAAKPAKAAEQAPAEAAPEGDLELD